MTETLIIKLGPWVDDAYDILDREGWGYKDTMNAKDAWESARGPWKADASRALNCDIAIVVNKEKKVVTVADLRGVEKIKEQGRVALIGKVLENHELIGKHLKTNKQSQNPINYINSREINNLFN